MPAYFGRVWSPDYQPIPDVDTLLVVRHQPDSSDRKVHIHMIIESDLSHKRLRHAYRQAYGLEDRMAVSFKDCNMSPIVIRYMLDHDNAEILHVDDSVVPLVKEVQQEVAELQSGRARVKEEYNKVWEEIRAKDARELQDHIDEWGIPELSTTTTSSTGYKWVYERLEYMTQHWFSVQKHYTWEDYTKLVVKYITWKYHTDYRYIFSTYRLRGDVQILYAKYNGVSTDSVHRIFGY